MAGGFGLNLAILAVLSVLMIPALIRSAGDDGWATIAVGQAIGLLGAQIIAFGWSFSGASEVARAWRDADAVYSIVRDSFVARCALAALVGCLALTALTVPDFSNRSLLVAGFFSTVSLGFRTNWLFVGLSAPRTQLILETLPRALGLVVGIVLLHAGVISAITALWIQAGTTAITGATSLVWSRSRCSGGQVPRRSATVLRLVRANSSGTLALTLSAAWSSIPLMALAAVSPNGVSEFALITRIQSQANTAGSAVVDSVQGWVGRERDSVHARARLVSRKGAVAALVGILVYIAAGAPVAKALGAGVVDVPLGLVVLSGVTVGLTFITQIVYRGCLAPLGMVKTYTASSLAGNAVGAFTLLLLVAPIGSYGAFTAITLSLFIQCCWATHALNVGINSREHPHESPSAKGTHL